MKIGRNDPCPCGSGKKYKKCCLNTELFSKRNQSGIAASMIINNVFREAKSDDLLKIIAGLSLLPQNHGKNVRIEEITLRILKDYQTDGSILTSAQIKKILDKEYPWHHMEDPASNLFTELITFYGGDHLIFPGITVNGKNILQNQLTAIFQWKSTNLPTAFVKRVKNAASLILEISDALARRLGYTRYMGQNVTHSEIFVPNNLELDALKSAVCFSEHEITLICNQLNIPLETIDDLLLDLASAALMESNGDNNLLVYTPILRSGTEYIVVSPSTLCSAASEFIWREARELNCENELLTSYHDMIWNSIQPMLQRMGFKWVESDDILPNTETHVKQALYMFDADKVAYIRYLGDVKKIIDPNTAGTDTKPHLEQADNIDTTISKIKSSSRFSHSKVLDFTILSPVGDDFYYLSEVPKDALSVVMPVYDFEAICNHGNTEALDLWKFAQSRENKLKTTEILSMSFLDQYKFYKDHQDSFYQSDNAHPHMIQIQVGYADELRRKSILENDKHSGLKVDDQGYHYVLVERKEEYAPIYFDRTGLLLSELEFLVEGFPQPVWVKPNSDVSSNKGGLRNMYWLLNDAIAYWLWQIQDFITPFLTNLSARPIYVTFDLISIESFETIDRNFARDPKLAEKFILSTTRNSLNVSIPPEIIAYLYGADNEGERCLVLKIMHGFNELLKINGVAEMSEERMRSIIENRAPLGMKKKVYILDTNDNLLLDPTNVVKHRYVQEYDVGVVLDSIVPQLGDNCPPNGDIKTQKERDNLAFKIVQNALLPMLRSKINQLNSTELIKKLIALNESLIKKKEYLRVETPTRIACYISSEQHQKELKNSMSNVSRTSIALRCLLEHVAAEPSSGTSIISVTAIDELVAIMDQIIAWGSISDQIHFDLFDIKMSVLESGRIGTSKSHINEVFDPYISSKVNEDITDTVNTFNQVFPQNENIIGKEIPKALDDAFASDFGISLSRICEFVDGLVQISFSQSTPYTSIPLGQLRKELNKYVANFEENEFQNAINFLTIRNRGKIETLPEGCDYIDILPWRFNRILSLMRKPLIIVDSENSESEAVIFWGVKQLLSSRLYLGEQCQSDRLRVPLGSQVKKVLGGFAKMRGDSLVNKVVSIAQTHSTIVDKEVSIGPNHQLLNDTDIGDVDVLVIDPTIKTVFSLECKSISMSRNIKEMIEEVGKLQGSDSERGWIDKHLVRHEWLLKNLDKLSAKYKIEMSQFTVKSFFVTQEDMLTPYLKKQSLPIPFVTAYELEQNGYDLLTEN